MLGNGVYVGFTLDVTRCIRFHMYHFYGHITEYKNYKNVLCVKW